MARGAGGGDGDRHRDPSPHRRAGPGLWLYPVVSGNWWLYPVVSGYWASTGSCSSRNGDTAPGMGTQPLLSALLLPSVKNGLGQLQSPSKTLKSPRLQFLRASPSLCMSSGAAFTGASPGSAPVLQGHGPSQPWDGGEINGLSVSSGAAGFVKLCRLPAGRAHGGFCSAHWPPATGT